MCLKIVGVAGEGMHILQWVAGSVGSYDDENAEARHCD
jgi:hypothetical protein